MHNSLQLVKSANFHGIQFDCYIDTDSNNENSQDFWATREQIGQLLEYEYPRESIGKIHERNQERIDKFSTSVKLTGVEGGREVTREVIVYNFKGLLEICRVSNQPKAKLLWTSYRTLLTKFAEREATTQSQTTKKSRTKEVLS